MEIRLIDRWNAARLLAWRALVVVAVGVLATGVPGHQARAQGASDSLRVAGSPVKVQIASPAYGDTMVVASGIRAHAVGVRPAAVDMGERGTTASDTTHRRRDHILLGMAIGTAAGAAIGYTAGRLQCQHEEPRGEGPPCELGTALGTVYLAIAGMFIGGIVGAYVERSVPGHPDRQVRIGAVPAGMDAMAVTVSVR